MILLDTDVLTALMRSEPEAVVAVDWFDAQPPESIWTTSVTVVEIRTGLELPLSSRRPRDLEAAFERVLDEDLDQRFLAFDGAAADAAGAVVARRQRTGGRVDLRDAQIAGMASARKATDLGVRLFDPWGSGRGPEQ